MSEGIYLGDKELVTEMQDDDTFVITTPEGIRRMTKAQIMQKFGINDLKNNGGGTAVTIDSTLTFSGKAADAAATGKAIEKLSNMAITLASMPVNDAGKKECSPIVSFMDDDCRSQTYTTLFPLIQELGIPYTLACPSGNIGKEDYMTEDQLLEMYTYGITLSCHAKTENNMDSLTEEELSAMLSECDEAFKNWGINDVKTYAYCKGVYVDDYINTVKKYFKMGFTVSNGINQIPYESYYMKRVGLFPTNGSFTLDDAKAYVNELVETGGWLVFMTHSWYNTFDADGLKELITYIQEKGIPIVDINEVIETTGNILETGQFKKPLEKATDSYFVIDSRGRAWSNAFNDTSTPDNVENVALEYRSGAVISNSTGKDVATSDVGYKVSLPVDVTDCEYIMVSAWAYGGFGLYSFLKADGTYLSGLKSTTSYSDGGDTLDYTQVEVPEEAASVIIAGYTYETPPALTKVYQKPAEATYVRTVNENAPDENGNITIKTPTKTSELQNDSGFLDAENKKELQKNIDEKVTNPSTGEIGQILEIETVDDTGKPLTYKAVNKPEEGVNVDAELREYYTTQKNQLAENIQVKGVATSSDDSLGTLVGKVLDIPSAVEPTETLPEQTLLIATGLQETLGIQLVWTDVDAAGYLIMRKEDSAPVSTADGIAVYNGAELTHIDTDVVRDKTYYYRIFPYNSLNQYQATEYRAVACVNYTDRSGQTTLGELALGDVIKFGQYGNSLYTWQIVDTLDKSKGYITVAADQTPGSLQFDAPENATDNPNPVTNRANQGNNRWAYSNIRQFLNSDAEADNWYTTQHDYDVAPNYKTKAGFLNTFTDFEKNIIVEKTNKCVLDANDGGGSETVIDKMWLATSYSMGLEIFQPLEDDHVFEAFIDATSRSYQSNYWLRTINGLTSASGVRYVYSSGSLSGYAASSNYAVRPFCCLPTSAYVRWSDSDSAYVFVDDSQRNPGTES